MAAITTYGTLQTAVADYLARSDLSSQTTDYFITLAEQRIYYGTKNPNLPGFDSPPIRVRAMESNADLVLKATVSAGTDSGSANAYVGTSASITSLVRGLQVSLIISNSNTGASTLNISGTGAVAIKKGDGTFDVTANDLVAGETQNFYYDGTYWRMVEPGSVPLPSGYLSMRRLYLATNPIAALNYITPEQMIDTGIGSTTGQPTNYTIESEFVKFGPVPDADYFARMLYWKKFDALASSSDTNWLLVNASGLYLYGALFEAAVLTKNFAEAERFFQMYAGTASGLTDANQLDRWSGSVLTIRSDVGNP